MWLYDLRGSLDDAFASCRILAPDRSLQHWFSQRKASSFVCARVRLAVLCVCICMCVCVHVRVYIHVSVCACLFPCKYSARSWASLVV